MGAWIDQNPGVAVTLLMMIVSGVVYIIRMEGELREMKTRISACEKRADEDRKDIKERLDSIDTNVAQTKSAVDQIVGALHGRRRVTDLSQEGLERL